MSTNDVVTLSARSPDFQRSFVAMCYFWGARDQALVEALGATPLQPSTADLLASLGQAAREERAKALSAELGRLATSLEQRSLLR